MAEGRSAANHAEDDLDIISDDELVMRIRSLRSMRDELISASESGGEADGE